MLQYKSLWRKPKLYSAYYSSEISRAQKPFILLVKWNCLACFLIYWLVSDGAKFVPRAPSASLDWLSTSEPPFDTRLEACDHEFCRPVGDKVRLGKTYINEEKAKSYLNNKDSTKLVTIQNHLKLDQTNLVKYLPWLNKISTLSRSTDVPIKIWSALMSTAPSLQGTLNYHKSSVIRLYSIGGLWIAGLWSN